MNKKVFTIIIILILLVIVTGVIYLYSRNLKVPEKLTAHMPRETVFYVEFNLRDEKLAKVYKNNFRAKIRFESLINESIFFGPLSEYLIQEADQVALLVIKHNNNWHKVWLVKADNIYRLNALLPVNFYSSILNAKTIALSPKRDVLKLIKEVNPLVEHSQEQREILNKFSSDNFINIYLTGEYIEFLADKPDLAYQLILNNLNLNYEQPAFLGLAAQENQIVYEFSAKSRPSRMTGEDYKYFPPEAPARPPGVDQPLADKDNDKDIPLNLPINNLFLTFVSANLKDIFDELAEEILNQDKKQEWSEKYEFEWQEIEDLLNHPGVIFAQSKNAKVSAQDIFDLDKYNYGLMIRTDFDENEMLEKIEQIKKVVKNILAFRYPSEKVKILPDKTKSIELVADARQFSFEKEDNLEYYESQNFNFVVGYRNGYLILGNNRDLIKKILHSQVSGEESGIPRDKLERCPVLTGQELAIINSSQLVEGLLSYIDQVVINFVQEGEKVELRGCLRW